MERERGQDPTKLTCLLKFVCFLFTNHFWKNCFVFPFNNLQLNSVLEYKVQVNDVFHFPAGWFHRVDHRGEYL